MKPHQSKTEMLPSALSPKTFSTSTFLSKRFSSENKPKSIPSLKKCDTKLYRSMGGAGRSCAGTIKRSRQNVAIATQVLSPRAIGSSLKCQSAVRHFGPTDDDEEGFLTYRRRAAWKKLFYYGLSIVGVILIITAIIIAMGFVQSEKQRRILSRTPSLKLLQERSSTSYIYTTPYPTKSLVPTESQEFLPTASSLFLVSPNKETEDLKEDGEVAVSEEARQVFAYKNKPDEHYSPDENDFNPHEDYKDGVLDEEEVEESEILKPEGFSSFLNGHGHYNHHHMSDTEPDEKEESDSEDEIYDVGDKKYGTESMLPSNDNFNNDDINAVVGKEKESGDNDKDITNNKRSDDDWKSFIVEDERNDQLIQNEEQADDRAALLVTEEVKVFDPHSQSDNHDDTVFSIEVPIYVSNRTMNAVQHHNDDDSSSTDPALDEENDNLPEILIRQEIKSDDSRADANKVHQVEVKEVDTDELQETIEGNDKSSSADETEEDEPADVPSEKSDDDDPVEDTFHRAVLHTALFHLGDHDNNNNHDISRVTSEDSDAFPNPEPLQYYRNEDEAKLFRPKSRRLENKIRGRNRKIKLFQNDKLMNLKATYAPIGHDKSNPSTGTIPSESTARNNAINRSESNSDFINISDFVTEMKKFPPASLSQTLPIHSKSIESAQEEEVETTRLLQSSPTAPSLEAILRSIFSTLPSQKLQQQYNSQDNMLNPGYQQPQAPNTDFGTSFAQNINHLISPVLLSHPSGIRPGVDDADPSSSQFRKRTSYSDHELFGNPSPHLSQFNSQPVNYFARFLEQNPMFGSIDSPSTSATGGSFNYYDPIFTTTTPTAASYDFSSSGTNDSPQQLTLPGVVPFDLSASYIPAGFPNAASSPQYFPQLSQTDSLSQLGHNQNTFYHTPTSFLSSSNPFTLQEPSQSNNPHNQFNPVNLGGNIGTLTTAGGQPPTYNTISQGMHLLNLISGVMPNTYFHDQVYNPSQQSFSSSIQPTTLDSTTHQNQIPNLGFPFMNNLASLGALSFGTTKPVTANYNQSPSPSYQIPIASSSDINSKSSKTEKPNKNQHSIRPSAASSSTRHVFPLNPEHVGGSAPLPEEDEDQLPAASALSQDISTSIPPPATFNTGKPTVAVGTEITPSLQSRLSFTRTRNEETWKEKSNSKLQSEPRSFSLEILPHKIFTGSSPKAKNNNVNSNIRSLNPEAIHTSSDNLVSESKSKKKGSVSLEATKQVSYNSLTTVPNAIFSRSGQKQKHLKQKERLPGLSTKQKLAPSKKQTLNSKHTKSLIMQKNNASRNNGLQSGFFVI